MKENHHPFLLTASFNGDINRYVLNAAGDEVLEHEVTFNGFGAIPLDVIAQGDTEVFPGTVWAATYGANNITIFEPSNLICSSLSSNESKYVLVGRLHGLDPVWNQ